MTYHSEGLLAKYGADNWLERNFGDLEPKLEKGIRAAEMPPWFLIRTYCEYCDEPCCSIRHRGERLLVVVVDDMIFLHQCPPPVEDVYPDDPNVRDGDGNIRGGGWSDDTWGQPPDYSDPPYDFQYPDVPYVPPKWAD